MSGCDHSFRAMGAQIRLIVSEASGADPPAEVAVADARRDLERFEATLSRLLPESELCALNADPRDEVPASPLMCTAVRAAVWAARRSGGLVDPTLLGALEDAGYVESREGVSPASLREALLFAPERRAATPSPSADWLRVEVDDERGLVRRPAGVRLDSGGVGKGLAADLIAERLSHHPRFVVDCGGDLRAGGSEAARDPFEILVEHPLTHEHAHVLCLERGAVATSGLDVRIWRRADGRYAHHLLDPATRRPAWTGLVGATAVAQTAIEAETLSKTALLSGPESARAVLAEQGGLIVHESGETEVVGPARVRPRYSITVPAQVAGRAGNAAIAGVAR